MNKLTKIAVLAIVAASVASVSASAQNVAANPTDLVLGFEVTDGSGTGATTDLEVDLGASSLFTTTANLTLSQLSSADLTSTYGSGWASRTDLTFGVAGVTDLTSNSFDATYALVAPRNASESTLAVPYGNISSLALELANNPKTSHSASSSNVGDSTTPANGIAGSFGNEENNGLGNSDYGYFTPSGVTEVNSGTGIPTGSISLYGFSPSAGRTPTLAADLGSFTLTSSGGLTFNGVNAQAVPEPSAYALAICAVVLFVVLKRRHSLV